MKSQVQSIMDHAQKDQVLGEVYEEFHPVSEKAGRVFGYCFGFRPIISGGAGVWAWCQYSVQDVNGFKDFGKVQLSRQFEHVGAARAWFKKSKADRIKANREKWARDGHRLVGAK